MGRINNKLTPVRRVVRLPNGETSSGIRHMNLVPAERNLPGSPSAGPRPVEAPATLSSSHDVSAPEAAYDHWGFDPDGYDREGYRYGYDREGFDPDGRGRDGRDRDGRDREGYDKDGRNIAGYDVYGFDRTGRDRHGRNIAGYDDSGVDVNGRNSNGLDKDGYDAQGYDYDGYDRTGYSKGGSNPWGFSRDGFHVTTGTIFTPTGVSQDGLSLDPASEAPAGTNPFNSVKHFLAHRHALDTKTVSAEELHSLARFYGRRGDRASLLALRRIVRTEQESARSSYDFMNPGQNMWWADEDKQREMGGHRHRSDELGRALWDINELIDPEPTYRRGR